MVTVGRRSLFFVPASPFFLPPLLLQELAASKITSAFKSLLPAAALCTRDGEESSVPAADLVIGDIVRIRTGTRIPADVRFLHVSDLKVRGVLTLSPSLCSPILNTLPDLQVS